MSEFFRRNKLFFAIIIAAFIIGGFVYFGLINLKTVEQNKNFENYSVSNKDISVTTGATKNNLDSVKKCGAENETLVTKVIDGDTVVVKGGEHVRLLGIDADEKDYPCYKPAKTRLEELVLNKKVKLEKDKTDLDQYGRCLRYIFSGDLNIGAQLVKEGLAIARFYEPNVKYKNDISEAEKQAIENKIGCKWSLALP